VDSVNAQVLFAGSQNVLLPAPPASKGTVEVQLTACGVTANTVQVVIQQLGCTF
jgi:hypothetical protein